MALGSESTDLSSTVCQLCRQRKIKCNRRQPSCGSCVKNKAKCKYTQKKKHGLRAGYVSELEKRIESIEDELQQFKSSQTIQGLEAGLSSQNKEADDQAEYLGHTIRKSIKGNQTSPPISPEAISHLTTATIQTLCEVWTRDYNQWCPILPRTSLQAALRDVSHQEPTTRMDVTLKSVVALTVSHSSAAISFGYNGRRQLFNLLRSEVLVEAQKLPTTLRSLQALLVIAILDYGNGLISDFRQDVEDCQRLCTRLGLLDIVRDQSSLQSMPPDLDIEQRIRAFWITQMFGMSLFPFMLAEDSRDRDHVAAINELNIDHLSLRSAASDSTLPESFDLYAGFVGQSLWNMPSGFIQPDGLDLKQLDEHIDFIQVLELDPELHSNFKSYQQDTNGILYFDASRVLLRMTQNAYIIEILQQQYIRQQPSSLLQLQALQDILSAIQRQVNTIKAVSDVDMEYISPFCALYFFIAARFIIVYCKLDARDRDPWFDLLMHALNMLARRFPIARNLEFSLRTAILEDSISVDESSLPKGFWDLKVPSSQLQELIVDWVRQSTQYAQLAGMAGPYA